MLGNKSLKRELNKGISSPTNLGMFISLIALIMIRIS
jgi:hypothetical protein